MNCKKCGNEIKNSYVFCINCGSKIEYSIKKPKIINSESKNNKSLKFLLSLFIILLGLSLIVYLICLFIIKNS